MQVISCSALILNEAGDRVLVSRRSDSRRVAPGLWEVIGGRLEFGEAPEACLRREVAEELGVAMVEPRLFGVYSCLSGEVHLVSVVYTCRVLDEPVPNPAEIAELGWIGPSEVDGLTWAANCGQRVADYFARRA
jgi:8-oxo-dGTP diphosphatase